MSTINYLTVRNTILPVVNAVTANYSTLTGSTITATSMNLTSATISLGASTNQTYNNFSNGSYLTWATAKSAMTSANKTVQSANGLYQMIVANATSGLYLSSDSGITWSTLTGGLPTLTGSAYWSDGAISANGQYITLSIYGGSLWMSADYGRTFALTNQPTPSIWLPLNGNTTDLMGLSVVTTPGTVPGYVTLNYPGYTAQAVNLANTAGGTATRYIQGTWSGATNFTVSFWMNPQSINFGTLFRTSSSQIAVYIINGILYYATITNGTFANVASTSNTYSSNSWNYITIIFQTNGLCSFYVNNTLIGSANNVGGLNPVTSYYIGCDPNQANAFNGYVDDLRITNSVSTYVPIPLLQPNIWLPFENTAGDLGSYSLPPSATPTIYLPFEGNVTDSMSFSTVTTPGTVPGYVPVNREGYTGQAVNLANTAGSNATRYVRGTWTGAANFTVSFWMNPQSLTSVQQQVFVAYTGSMVVYITGSNQLAWYMPSGGGTTALTIGTTSFALVTNTWYYVTIIFQTSGVCSFYVNNALIATYTNVSGVGTLTTTQFSLGCNDNSIISSFNGYIDDLRIYNSAIPYVPVSVTTVTGSLSYVPGVVGLNAVNLVNTAGAAATNYIRGTPPSGQTYTLSGWYNFQSLPTSGFSVVVFLGSGSTNELGIYFQFGVGLRFSYGNSIVYTQSSVPLNTWIHCHFMNQLNGTSILHINGVQVASVAITTLNNTPTILSLGCNAPNTDAAFNGYIDDFRLYNAAIPYHALFPQNYRSLALSGTGQYTLASAASGWVIGSSDSSKTWSKQAVCVGTQGDIIQPNMSGLPVTATTWTQNGVTWTATESSNNGASQSVSRAFNNTVSSDAWLSNNTTQRYTAGSPNGNAASTNIQTIGLTAGEWIQIESSIPMVLASFAFGIGLNAYPSSGTPKTYYIVGSNDNSTWVPLQFGNFTVSAWTSTSSNITMNITGTQPFNGNMVGSVATTAYPSYTPNAYRYFRLIGTSLMIYGGSAGTTYMEVGEWYLNFVRPLTLSRPPAHALSLNHTGQYQLVATGPAAGSIMPNLTGLAASTWTQSGVNWGVSASNTFSASFPSYNAFNNNTTINNIWAPSSTTYSTAGNSSGVTMTIQGGVGTVTGDWLQIQSSVPLVMSSYQFASGGNTNQLPKTYYIVGSNDGSTWYPIQFGSGGAVTSTTAYTLVPGVISVNSASTQTFGSSTITTTTYSTTTNAYTYFRLIGMTIYVASGSGAAVLEISEWLINFSNSVSYSTNYGATWLNTSQTVSNESVALSSSGQYALSTNSVAPLARLPFDGTNVDAYGILVFATGAGTVTYSTSIKAVGTHSAFFNNTAGAAPSMYLNYTVPTALSTPSTLTMACWVYPSAYAVSANSYFLNLGSTTQYGCSLGFGAAGEIFSYTGKTSGGAQQTIGAGTAPLNTWTHVAMTYNANVITLYVNGVVSAQSAITGNLSLVGGGNITNLLVGCSAIAQALNGYVDDVRIYTSALSATAISTLYNNPTITQSQIMAVSNSYLPITSYTFPALTGIGTANIIDTAVSQTGQYMVAVTSSTTNNVYYSTDYGATFTALTVGSSAMVSCSISYDGSYLTVESATTVHTLNRNTRGFSVTVGNQAGLINQAQNTIAIGNQAGRTNQSANSIVLNATGNALDAVAPGFYVAPVATTTSSNATSFALLGYGTDNQVTQTNLTVLANGNVGLGMTNPSFTLHTRVASYSAPVLVVDAGNQGADATSVPRGIGKPLIGIGANSWSNVSSGDYYGIGFGYNANNPAYYYAAEIGFLVQSTAGGESGDIVFSTRPNTNGTVSATERMRITSGGSVGIGTANPGGTALRLTNSTNGDQLHLQCTGSTYAGHYWAMGHNSSDGAIYLNSSFSGTANMYVRPSNVSSTGWQVFSDRRLKENIVSLNSDDMLERIRKIRPVTFNMRCPNNNAIQIGVIAQEVQEIFPDMVSESQTTVLDIENPLGISLTGFVIPLLSAFQQLDKEQKDKIVALESQVSTLLAWAQTQGFSGTF